VFLAWLIYFGCFFFDILFSLFKEFKDNYSIQKAECGGGHKRFVFYFINEI
jgi:hypothetical protein